MCVCTVKLCEVSFVSDPVCIQFSRTIKALQFKLIFSRSLIQSASTFLYVCMSWPLLPFVLQCIFASGKAAHVTIEIDDKKEAQTSNERDRVWNETFQILCAHPSDSMITIAMKTSCCILGKISIQANQILNEASLINGFFPLLMENGRPNPELKLRFMLWFKPAAFEPSWRKILSNGDFQGMRSASFPQRSNCHVTLYQDAHHLSTFQPPFLPRGAPRRLWEDVYKAIEGAKYLIYIVGWSFNPKLVLVSIENPFTLSSFLYENFTLILLIFITFTMYP